MPDARDPLGREGDAVTLRPDARGEQAEPERFTVIFDPETSELLSWSLDGRRLAERPDQTRTFVRAAHVRRR